MKLTIEIGRDEELRKEILHLIRVEIQKITNDEIKSMAKEYLTQVNITAKATNAIKELLNKQLTSILQGYGELSIKKEVETKINEWFDKNFVSYFNQNIKGFIKEYIEGKVNTIQEFLALSKKVKQ